MPRNAVSHGIELPDERKTQGKPLPGRVSLSIESLGNRLAIVVEDDGRGVDLARAADVAVRSGLGSAAEVQAWSPQHLLELLTRPGFSTCDTVTELAGRGLGLSIAADVVNRLQGALVVRPRDGGRHGGVVRRSLGRLDASLAAGFVRRPDFRHSLGGN